MTHVKTHPPLHCINHHFLKNKTTCFAFQSMCQTNSMFSDEHCQQSQHRQYSSSTSSHSYSFILPFPPYSCIHSKATICRPPSVPFYFVVSWEHHWSPEHVIVVGMRCVINVTLCNPCHALRHHSACIFNHIELLYLLEFYYIISLEVSFFYSRVYGNEHT